MPLRLKVILLVLILLTMLTVLKRVRKKKLLLQYTLSWLSLLIVLMIIVIWPGLLTHLSNLVGIQTPMNMVFFLGFCFSLIIVFGLTQIVSEMSDQIKNLTHEVALLKKEKEGESNESEKE